MNSSRSFLRASAFLLLLAVLVLTGATHRGANLRPGTTAEDKLPSPADLSVRFERAAERIRPSVVTIFALRRLTAEPDPYLEELWRAFGADASNIGTAEVVQRGLGSGLIVSADGDVVTNDHVIGGADEVVVQLPNGKRLPARVVGRDEHTDLAMIRIEAGGLTPARLADSDRLRIGQWVIAAGNPFGLTSTITAGIVSAKRTDVPEELGASHMIQTDAAINPGNSGGPLVNLNGEVVGINSAILTGNGGYMGIGFAIPSNEARRLIRNMAAIGRPDPTP
jgi:serine protease Do